MNCQEFKSQFEDGLNLSHAAKIHQSTCKECGLFQSEELQLTEMIRSLPKVKAPNDFEFGFRSKLAKAEASKPFSPIWKFLRFAMPLTAAGLILGFVIFSSNIFKSENAPQLAEKPKIEEKSVEPKNDLTPTGNLVAEEANNDSEKVEVKTVEAVIKNQKENTPSEITVNNSKASVKKDPVKDEIRTLDSRHDKDSTQTLESTLGIEKVIRPPGIDPDKVIDSPRMPLETKAFTAKEILSELGIETNDANGSLKVSGIRKNSAGEVSGIKIGDIVTAIDGQTITDKPLQKGSIQGKTLKIQRDERELDITIRNK